MSVSHSAHSFRQTTGVGPHQYVLRRRIERARNLFADPKLGVADVALHCGFSNQSHFSETFRRVVGTTPRQYRVALGARREPVARQAPAAKQQKTDSSIAESRKKPARRLCWGGPDSRAETAGRDDGPASADPPAREPSRGRAACNGAEAFSTSVKWGSATAAIRCRLALRL